MRRLQGHSTTHIPDDADELCAAAAAPRPPRDDAPMTPVIYLVLWTSVAVGVLRGYIVSDVIGARQTTSYTLAFSGHQQEAALSGNRGVFCATGIDGLPGMSGVERVLEALPVVAPVFGAVFLKRRGRRMGIMLGLVLAISGQMLLAAAVHVKMLYIGAAVVRSASDILFLATGMQVVEIAPRTSRGRFLSAHVLGVAFGMVMAATVAFFVSDQPAIGWRLMFGLGMMPAAAVLAVVPFVLETPNSLIQRGKYAEGWAALRDIRGPFYDAYPEFAEIVAASTKVPHSFNLYLELIKDPMHRPALAMGLVLALLSSLLNPLSMTYVSFSVFRLAGYKLSWAVFITNFTMSMAFALGVVLASLLVDRAGRLLPLRLGGAAAIAALLALLASNLVYSRQHPDSGAKEDLASSLTWAWMQLGILSVLSGANGFAWYPISWTIIIESQALVIRPGAVALCICASGLGASLIESTLLCAMGMHYFIFVLGLSIFSLLCALLLLPETACAPLESVNQLWLDHWLWRRVVRLRGGGAGIAAAAAAAAQPAPDGDQMAAIARVVATTMAEAHTRQGGAAGDGAAAAPALDEASGVDIAFAVLQGEL